ncbi:MAG: S8 family serine peptidase [Bifidobacteriaceae bacterium]|nr:S8 family serine peptidase [Bifidobacteriaceae bacterium]
MTSYLRNKIIYSLAGIVVSIGVVGLTAVPAASEPSGDASPPAELTIPSTEAASADPAGDQVVIQDDGLTTVVATGPADIAPAAVVSGGLHGLAVQRNVAVHSGAGASVVMVRTADPEGTIAAMEASGLYRTVGLDYPVQPLLTSPPNDPYLNYSNPSQLGQWGLRNDQGNSAWGSNGRIGSRFVSAWPLVGGNATTTKIAVVDTAFPASNHPDLAGIVQKYDTADNDANVRLPASVTNQANFHGAAVSSIIGAVTNNSNALAGAAYDTQVLFYKTMFDSTALQGGENMDNGAVAAAVRRASADGAKVINMSLGSSCIPSAYWSYDPLYQAIQDVVKAGVTVVASAGNWAEEGNPLGCPASYPGVIAVGATNPNGTRAAFSEYNQYVDIAAPGVDIWTMTNNPVGSSYSMQGTSAAAPHVAAAAGLLKRTNPSLTPAQVERILLYTAQDAGTFGWDSQFGWGILDATKALQFANNPNGARPVSTTFVPHARQVAVSPDLNGDGRGDLLVRDSMSATVNGSAGAAQSKLLVYPFTASATLGSPIYAGVGWGNLTVYGPGDWSGDGKADVMATNSSGDLYMYRGAGNGTLTGSGVRVGWGWTDYRIIPSGDMNGDRKADLLAIHNPTGDLWLYPGDGAGSFRSRVKVGNGWQGFELYAAGDLNGDGRGDILSVQRSTGDLYRYLGRGGGFFATKLKVGNGWNGFQLASGASLDGDRYSDIVGLSPDWTLYYYKGLGGGQFATKKQIGNGF